MPKRLWPDGKPNAGQFGKNNGNPNLGLPVNLADFAKDFGADSTPAPGMGTYLQTTTEKLDVLNFHLGHEVPSPLDIVMMLEEGEAEDEPTSPDGLRGVPPDALKRLLMFIIPPETSPQRWAVATKRLVVLSHLAGVEGVAEHSLATLAKQLDCTRAILSLHSLGIVDALQQSQSRGGKQRASRETYRKATTAYHKRAGHNMSHPE